MQPTAERWLPIPGYEGLYEVSNLGALRSRFGRLKVSPDSVGYLRVTLRGEDRRIKALRVHNLVLLAFVGPLLDGAQVRHLDGNHLNNALANLAYGTSSENNLDRVRHGTHHQTRKTHCPEGHPYSGANLYVKPSGSRICRSCKNAQRRA